MGVTLVILVVLAVFAALGAAYLYVRQKNGRQVNITDEVVSFGARDSGRYGADKAVTSPPAAPVPYFSSPQIINITPNNMHHIIADNLVSGQLAASLPPGCGTTWFLLYNSNLHGKSFQKFVQSISGKGATIILVKLKGDSQIIGGFCGDEWQMVGEREKAAKSRSAAMKRASREGQKTDFAGKPENQDNTFFGNGNCFIFSIKKKNGTFCDFHVYKDLSSENANYMYLFDTHPLADKVGIGMGGKDGYFGWFLDRWLDKGYCMGARCTTFKCPRLTDTEVWEVDSVEAYAVQQEVVNRLRNTDESQTRSILTGDPDRNADKMLLELHGVHHFDNDRTECGLES